MSHHQVTTSRTDQTARLPLVVIEEIRAVRQEAREPGDHRADLDRRSAAHQQRRAALAAALTRYAENATSTLGGTR